MTNIVDCVRGNSNESHVETNEVQKGECSISLENAPQPRSEDENAPARSKRCDYSFVAAGGKNWVTPVELKATRLGRNKIAGQPGADAAARIAPRWIDSDFVPVAIAKIADKRQSEDLGDPDKMIRWAERPSDLLRRFPDGSNATIFS